MANIQKLKARLRAMKWKVQELEERIKREEEGRSESNNPHPTFVPRTLCDVCDKACGHCSWSEKGVQRPVEGWTAIRRDLTISAAAKSRREDLAESYVVLECPEFVVHPGEEWAYDRFDPERLAIINIRELSKEGA